jgi:hypothetical protein
MMALPYRDVPCLHFTQFYGGEKFLEVLYGETCQNLHDYAYQSDDTGLGFEIGSVAKIN